jgi:3-oxoadipate enol-lactonase
MSYVTTNGVKLFYEEQGEGEPLLLLNGIFMSTKSWAIISNVLAKKYRVILHDFRGQGLSDKPSGDYTFNMHSDDIKGLLESLNIKSAHIAGTSYGGEAGMDFASRFPEMVKTLTIISSVSEIDMGLKLICERWINALLTKDAEVFIKEWLNDTYSEQFLKNTYSIIHPKILESFEDFDYSACKRLMDCFMTLEKNPQTGKLSSITAPTLVIAGELDTLKPLKYSEIIHRAIKNSELHVVKGAGHAVTVERPQEILTLILGFIEKTELLQS